MILRAKIYYAEKLFQEFNNFINHGCITQNFAMPLPFRNKLRANKPDTSSIMKRGN